MNGPEPKPYTEGYMRFSQAFTFAKGQRPIAELIPDVLEMRAIELVHIAYALAMEKGDEVTAWCLVDLGNRLPPEQALVETLFDLVGKDFKVTPEWTAAVEQKLASIARAEGRVG